MLPDPECALGYPANQLAAILGPRLAAFEAWYAAQPGSSVHGRVYGRGRHALVAYPVCTGRQTISQCTRAHGLVVPQADLAEFLRPAGFCLTPSAGPTDTP
jgi:hypothetical protein